MCKLKCETHDKINSPRANLRRMFMADDSRPKLSFIPTSPFFSRAFPSAIQLQCKFCIRNNNKNSTNTHKMPHVLYELYMHDNSYNVDDNKLSQKPSKFSQFPWHTTYLIKWISSAKQNAQYNNFDRLYLKGKEIVDE